MSADGDYDITLAEFVATYEAQLAGEQYNWLHPSAAASIQTYLADMREAALRHDGGEVCRLSALIRTVFEREACSP